MRLPPLLPFFCLMFVCPAFASIVRAAADEPPRLFPSADVDVKPTPKKPIKVRFPGSVRKKGETPQIVLRFIVTAEGDVTKVIVVMFSHPDMIEPAMEAYEKAKFNPGMKNGKLVETLMEATETYPSK